MKKLILTLGLVAFLAISQAGLSKADVIINVDFGPAAGPLYSGAAAASFGDAAHVWNGVSADTASGLQDSNGDATGFGLTLTGAGNFSNQPASANLAGADALMQDYRFTFGSRRIDITGFTPGDIYEIYIYSAGNGSTLNQGSQFFIPVDTGGTTYSPSLDVFNTPSNPFTTADGSGSLALGVNYQRFTGVIGSGGFLSFEQGRNTGQTTGAQVINGFQLNVSAVPEPVGLFMVSCLLSGLACRRRR